MAWSKDPETESMRRFFNVSYPRPHSGPYLDDAAAAAAAAAAALDAMVGGGGRGTDFHASADHLVHTEI